MRTITSNFAALAITAAIASPAFAQEPMPRPTPVPEEQQPAPITQQATPSEATEASSVKGSLVKVDADLMELTIKGADDTMHTFRFADSTAVVGADGPVTKLASKAGSDVKVYFTSTGDTKIATKIEFEKAE